jgi:hypothetical protein
MQHARSMRRAAAGGGAVAVATWSCTAARCGARGAARLDRHPRASCAATRNRKGSMPLNDSGQGCPSYLAGGPACCGPGTSLASAPAPLPASHLTNTTLPFFPPPKRPDSVATMGPNGGTPRLAVVAALVLLAGECREETGRGTLKRPLGGTRTRPDRLVPRPAQQRSTRYPGPSQGRRSIASARLGAPSPAHS